MRAWRRFCALRDRYARSLTWLVCACERRPALSFAGVWGGAFCAFVRLCWCLLRAGYAVGAAFLWRLLRVAGVSAWCGARVLTCGVSRVGARWLSCCLRVARAGRVCRLVAFLRHRSYRITVFISGFTVFLTPVKRCLFLAVLRGFLVF